MRSKKFFLLLPLILLFALPQGLLGQDRPRAREIKRDTTEITWRNKRMIIISNGETRHIEISTQDDDSYTTAEKRSDWNPDTYDYTPKETRRYKKNKVGFLGVDLGVANYMQNGVYGSEAAPAMLGVKDFRPASHVALHFLPTQIGLIGKGKVNLKTAFTVDWNHLHFTEDITLKEGQENLTIDSANVNFSQNKLVSRYAMVPLLLNFNTHPGDKKKNVSVSAGVYGGILWAARTKQVSDDNGKVKLKGDFNLNPIKYGLTARLDYRWFDIYVNYNLSSLFEEEQGPDAQILVAGINFIDF
ncbi:MAG: outer membrane beta-barrel protein [Bacteroidota bacterium]